MPADKKEFKEFAMELRSMNDDGTFIGHVSVFGNVDSYGDVVDPGAFKKTLAERKAKKGEARFPLLWNHNPDEPIGSGIFSEDAIGLRVDGRMNMDVPRAVWTRALYKAGDLDGMSFAFGTIKDKVKDGIRHLKELRLWEGSPVTFSANEAAVMTEVRSTQGDDPTPPGAGNVDIEPEAFHSLTAQMKSTLKTLKEGVPQ